MALVVHVHHCRLGAQQMVVDGGDFHALLDQLLHHRIHFFLQQHQIAHHHGLLTAFLERQVAAERERRLDLHAVERHREITAPYADAIDAARHFRAGTTDRLGDGIPIGVGGAARQCGAGEKCKACNLQ